MDKSKQKIVFERDYTSVLKQIDAKKSPEDKILVKRVLALYEQSKFIPFVVDKKAAADFYKMVVTCDKIAKEFSGKLTATIDFEYHNASITTECLYVDFDVGEFMGTLQEMAAKAYQVRFEPLISGLLRISISMPYFSRPKIVKRRKRRQRN